MLKPSEIRNYEFKPAGRNTYRAEEVDAFFAEVLISYERVFRENSELVKRASLLADKLEQYKHDEVDIKQAVLSAQKAADIIIRDAEEAVEDSKKEAEAILAAAKGEAMVIRTDAEKQAIADSDLLMSIAKDKAEEIIKKAKEKAHTILIAANNSANDKMGAANRTITSESLHYDMLKKEVSEFRASILAQYKSHIELISKLPELAVEEASKIEIAPSEEPTIDDVKEEIDESFYASEDSVLEFVENADDETVNTDDAKPTDIEEESSSDEAAEEIYFDDSVEAEAEVVEEDFEEEDYTGEEVVKTTLPYDFFAEDTTLEFIDDDSDDELSIEIGEDNSIPAELEKYLVSEDNDQIVDIEPVEDIFSDSTEPTVSVDSIQDDFFVSEAEEEEAESFEDFVDSLEAAIDENEENEEQEPQKSIIEDYGSYNSFFDSIEVIDTDIVDERDDDRPKRGFFFRKK